MNFNPAFLLILSLVPPNILSRTALFLSLKSHDLWTNKHSFQTENTVFQTSISPCFLFPRLFTTPRQVHPLLRRGLGRLSPFFPLFLSTTIENGNFLTLCHPFHWNIPFNKWKTSLPPVLITSKPRLPTLLRQAHPLLRLPKVKSKDFPRKVYIPL